MPFVHLGAFRCVSHDHLQILYHAGTPVFQSGDPTGLISAKGLHPSGNQRVFVCLASNRGSNRLRRRLWRPFRLRRGFGGRERDYPARAGSTIVAFGLGKCARAQGGRTGVRIGSAVASGDPNGIRTRVGGCLGLRENRTKTNTISNTAAMMAIELSQEFRRYSQASCPKVSENMAGLAHVRRARAAFLGWLPAASAGGSLGAVPPP